MGLYGWYSSCGCKFAEQWLLKAKILGLADEQITRFFKTCTDLKQPYLSSMELKNFMKLKKAQLFCLVSYQVNESFCCTKGLYEMKN